LLAAQAGLAVNDALIVIDVIPSLEHEDADALLGSFRQRLPAIRAAIEHARGNRVPVIYVNDQHGHWDSDAPGLIRAALEGPAGDLVAELAPERDDYVLLKPRYSVFDHTPLQLLLDELQVERLLLVGATTEGCVVQSGIDARELGYKVTILANACATIDEQLEKVSLRYAEQVGGIRLSESLE
jgi:nicotinamidase-related amidase